MPERQESLGPRHSTNCIFHGWAYNFNYNPVEENDKSAAIVIVNLETKHVMIYLANLTMLKLQQQQFSFILLDMDCLMILFKIRVPIFCVILSVNLMLGSERKRMQWSKTRGIRF